MVPGSNLLAAGGSQDGRTKGAVRGTFDPVDPVHPVACFESLRSARATKGSGPSFRSPRFARGRIEQPKIGPDPGMASPFQRREFFAVHSREGHQEPNTNGAQNLGANFAPLRAPLSHVADKSSSFCALGPFCGPGRKKLPRRARVLATPNRACPAGRFLRHSAARRGRWGPQLPPRSVRKTCQRPARATPCLRSDNEEKPAMRTILSTVLGLLLVATAAVASADDARLLQGTWKIVAVEAMGQAEDLESFGLDAIVIQGNRLTLSKGGEAVLSVDLTVNESISPKQMIWSDKEQGALPAIYELRGNTLRVCFPLVPSSKENDIPPPESFQTKDKPLALLTTERQQ
ncbi:MAG: TIGR03067 domain-containing protein [Planctomycetota bacterium]|nr:MAG: TIGR03067 domain-containing protein [Planctomycetota bacterium]